MTLLEIMQETLESGDPIIRGWPLVESYYMPFLCSAIYVLVVKRIGPSVMENRKPFDLRNIMILYNFAIVATYAVGLLMLCWFFLTTDAYKNICTPREVRMDDWSYSASYVAWVLYVIKYIEYADTVFFVLRKKDHLITNLHVIHHAVLPIIAWVMLRSETSGFQFIPGAINSFIHVIMYTYYGLAAMGPHMQRYLWWKEYLTRLQMLQFVVILFFVTVLIPLSGCKTSKHGIYMDFLFACLFLALFYNFYTKTYKRAPHKSLADNNGKANGYANGSAPTRNGKVEENGHKKEH